MDKIDLDKICSHISSCERKAQKASRDSIKHKQVEYLSDRIGSIFNSVITSVHEFGFFVEMLDNGCDCLCKLRGSWYYENGKIKDKINGGVFSVGDEVMVIVESCDINTKTINVKVVF